MRTLFVATAAFAALVMVAPIGNAHAAPYDSEARQPSPMGMAVYACGGFYPVDKKTGDAVIETAAADDADAASGSDRWSTLDDKRAILAMHCLALEMDRLAANSQRSGDTVAVQKARGQALRARAMEASLQASDPEAKRMAETTLSLNAPPISHRGEVKVIVSPPASPAHAHVDPYSKQGLTQLMNGGPWTTPFAAVPR